MFLLPLSNARVRVQMVPPSLWWGAKGVREDGAACNASRDHRRGWAFGSPSDLQDWDFQVERAGNPIQSLFSWLQSDLRYRQGQADEEDGPGHSLPTNSRKRKRIRRHNVSTCGGNELGSYDQSTGEKYIYGGVWKRKRIKDVCVHRKSSTWCREHQKTQIATYKWARRMPKMPIASLLCLCFPALLPIPMTATKTSLAETKKQSAPPCSQAFQVPLHLPLMHIHMNPPISSHPSHYQAS